MAGRTSSAQPRQLYRYADVALRLDHELGSESARLGAALHHFEATCQEPGMALRVSYLADMMRGYARDSEPVEYWVHGVGQAFERADQWWFWICSYPSAPKRMVFVAAPRPFITTYVSDLRVPDNGDFGTQAKAILNRIYKPPPRFSGLMLWIQFARVRLALTQLVWNLRWLIILYNVRLWFHSVLGIRLSTLSWVRQLAVGSVGSSLQAPQRQWPEEEVEMRILRLENLREQSLDNAKEHRRKANSPAIILRGLRDFYLEQARRAEDIAQSYEQLIIEWRKRGTPFLDEPTLDDIQQGSLADCYLLAGFGAVAHTRPEIIRRAIVPNQDGTYSVTFFEKDADGNHVPITVTVSAELPYGFAESTQPGELWVSIMEKGYVAWKVHYDSSDPPGTIYNVTEVDYKQIEWGDPGVAVEEITGYPHHTLVVEDMSAGQIGSELEQALRNGDPITVAFLPDTIEKLLPITKGPDGIVNNHAFVVKMVDGDKVVLYNPYGKELTLTLEEFKKYVDYVAINDVPRLIDDPGDAPNNFA